MIDFVCLDHEDVLRLLARLWREHNQPLAPLQEAQRAMVGPPNATRHCNVAINEDHRLIAFCNRQNNRPERQLFNMVIVGPRGWDFERRITRAFIGAQEVDLVARRGTLRALRVAEGVLIVRVQSRQYDVGSHEAGNAPEGSPDVPVLDPGEPFSDGMFFTDGTGWLPVS